MTHIYEYHVFLMNPCIHHYKMALFLIILFATGLFCLILITTVAFLCLFTCFNRIPQTGWLKNNRNLFLTILGAGSLRSGCKHDQVLVRDLFRVAGCWLLVSSYNGKGTRELSGAIIYNKGINFIMRAPPS